MRFVFTDGGRAAAGHKGKVKDCVTRSIAIATGRPYQEVYDALNQLSSLERFGKKKKTQGAREVSASASETALQLTRLIYRGGVGITP